MLLFPWIYNWIPFEWEKSDGTGIDDGRCLRWQPVGGKGNKPNTLNGFGETDGLHTYIHSYTYNCILKPVLSKADRPSNRFEDWFSVGPTGLLYKNKKIIKMQNTYYSQIQYFSQIKWMMLYGINQCCNTFTKWIVSSCGDKV